jgi:hypothetical protein
VSHDNPYSESLRRTLMHRPDLSIKAFEGLLQARRWLSDLLHGYDDEHRDRAIGVVTPSQRQAGQDKALLKVRVAVYKLAGHANRLLAMSATDMVKSALMANTEAAVGAGAFGSPTFLVGSEIFFSEDRLRDVAEAVVR